ncbi:G5 domain-containing protein [Candidatus Nanosynbacter sp. TM7-076]|uniref:resuscitation-promoting factor n=1 Tax=Candidatus Nanosynbacter sp. TM7-076 TaxID=2902629 RepID=UPI001FB848D6|nr:resuscitation-promoting factor [Candidatus Nanosynbacter sp. TM7-076]MCJ1967692.1 G5 domain-containing protein [Candidatus Nanosynbacter sp. TM7-076]
MGIRLQAKHYSKKITFVSGAILMLVGGLFFVNQALADATKPATKAGEKLVTIYDRGAEKTIVTKARTIREALKLAKFSIDERQDVVEPSLDSEMVAEKYNINIFRARPITIVDGNKRLKVTTAEQTPALIAKAAGIEVFEEDKTTLSNSDNMAVDGANMVMKIDRASMVNFVLYGKESVIRTHAKTVGELLKEKNIDPKKDDTLSVDRSAKIIPGMKIELWRNGKQTITAEEDVKFEVEKVQDANRDSGYREVKQAGENGKKNVTYEVEMKNGVEVSRKEIASVVTKEPKKQIEIVGTKSSTSFSGSFSEALARLRSCEGSYTSNTGNGYYGAYQFDKRTWGNYGGYELASDAPAAVQDEKAWQTYKARGWQPWPTCKVKMGLQDIYR